MAKVMWFKETLQRPFETTHPWLSFTLDLRAIPVPVWLLLGEASSKCEHLAGVPLRPDTAKRLHAVYLAKGVQGTTAIEGNTLSEEQVEEIINGSSRLPPSKQYLKKEVQNILDACQQILDVEKFEVTRDTICELNKNVLQGLSLDEGVVPGMIRKHTVGVMRYRAPLGDDCEFLVEKLCRWLAELDQHMPPYIGRIGKAVLRAIVAHLYTAWIHPFGDGNGRTARLIEVAILLEAGVPTPAAHLLSNHYNETRAEYYRQLDFASKSKGDIMPFIEYALTGLVDGLRGQIARIRDQQMDVVWRNYVHELFRGDDIPSRRRKHLILDLARRNEFVLRRDLMSITTRVLSDYQGKTERTLSRDLLALTAEGLIHHVPKKGFRAKTEIIAAFLPRAKAAASVTGDQVE
jgi:Fic family protein